ncbi:unnamed protein product [Agarophyton chilense]|eukprot:gb/GEZJ01004110.1/.p1 GENE.gb/GEZJ01004110.1/~~gb/GEZJ01004110.1/.p1  ORF type:complete len:399 (-),score=46.42 gb/GEZJ01004110.1/:646-1800(-)
MSSDEPPPPQIAARTLRAFTSPVSAISAGHAAFVFSCSSAADRLCLHDTSSGQQVISLHVPAQRPSHIAVAADGAKCAFATITGAVYIWDMLYPTSMESFRPSDDHPSPVTDMEWHPRGHVLAVATESGQLYLWDHVVGALLYPLPAHSGRISAVRWTAHGRLLVSVGASDALLRVWNPRNVNNLADVSAETEHSTPVKWHARGITCLDTLHDMSRIAITGGPDGSVLLSVLKPESQCGVFASMNAHQSSVSCVRIAPIGSPRPLRSVSADVNGSVHLFDMDRRLPMGKFSHGNDPVVQLEFSHHADVLFSAAGHTVMAWDARVAPEEQPPITFGTDAHTVNAFALLNSGANLVTACQDGVLRTYDMRYPSGDPPPLPVEEQSH